MLEIRPALEFVRGDPRAREKMAMGAVLMLVPFLNLAAFGYEVEVARRVARGEPRPLPEWDDLGRLWKVGAWLGLVYFIYGIPIILIGLAAFATVFATLILALQSDSAQTGGSPTMPAGPLAALVVLFGLLVAYSALLGLLRPGLVAQYVQRGTVQACFDFRAIGRMIRDNLGDYARLWLTELVLSWVIVVPLILIVFIFSFVPLAGPLIATLVSGAASFYLILVGGHLVGQLIRARPAASI
jgi:hypothetical protein